MNTYTANPDDRDSVASALLAKYRDQNANPVDGCTVEIEDHGQDFLEFDIVGGRIVATRPFQGFVWNGRVVRNATLAPGDYLYFGGRSWLNYPVTDVRAIAPVAPASSQPPARRPKPAGKDACATACAKKSAYEQRIPRFATTQRKCLCCGKPFASQGPHNRLCTPCRGKSAGPYDLY